MTKDNQSSCSETMTKKCNRYGLVISLVIFAFSICYAGAQIHDGLTNFKSFDRSVSMKGLAQRHVVADLALWPIAYTETGNDLTLLQNVMDQKGEEITSFLKNHGLKDAEIELQKVQVQDLMAQSYRQNNAGNNRYILTQTYLVRTNNIDAVYKASKKMGDLIRKGIVFSQSSSTTPTYLYTKLNDIKPEMIAEATKNARTAANEFANNSGQEVGGIKSASQGIFQILPRDQTYMIPEAQQKDKTVRVVSTIRFYLED